MGQDRAISQPLESNSVKEEPSWLNRAAEEIWVQIGPNTTDSTPKQSSVVQETLPAVTINTGEVSKQGTANDAVAQAGKQESFIDKLPHWTTTMPEETVKRIQAFERYDVEQKLNGSPLMGALLGKMLHIPNIELNDSEKTTTGD